MNPSQLNQQSVRLKIDDKQRTFEPGDTLAGSFVVDVPNPEDVKAIELSVLWYTEGKGDEDMAVHFFDRLDVDYPTFLDLRQPRHFGTQLPNSPLSYDGMIMKIRWCVRLRVFLRRGRDIVVEEPFELGHVPPAEVIVP